MVVAGAGLGSVVVGRERSETGGVVTPGLPVCGVGWRTCLFCCRLQTRRYRELAPRAD